jgi:hypothetical protein
LLPITTSGTLLLLSLAFIRERSRLRALERLIGGSWQERRFPEEAGAGWRICRHKRRSSLRFIWRNSPLDTDAFGPAPLSGPYLRDSSKLGFPLFHNPVTHCLNQHQKVIHMEEDIPSTSPCIILSISGFPACTYASNMARAMQLTVF